MTLQLPSILKHKGIVILLLLSIIATYKPVFGQVYPVQANINIIPPYTIYLHQYTSADQQKLIVNILLHDPVVTSVDVRFRFTIEGGGVRIYTNPGWIPQPFNILNGISSQIPRNIIAEYFQPQHLIVEGINPQEFYRSGRLPEGFYQFKVEVLEYQRGSIISNTGLAGVWLLLNESPRIVFPTPNQKVKATNPQMLNFTWVPGGISSPLSALNTMYEFTMVEIPDQMDPTIAITTASDAIKFTRTLQQTSLFYGPGEPQLIPGKKYAVRVRAFNTDGLEIFKNNGYSEVRVFQFGETCNSPISFDLNDETQSTFNIEVQTDPSNTAWQANFRESGSSDWSELKAEGASSEKTVRGLKASTIYEVQLKGLCGPFASDFTFSKTITTMERTNTERICENTTSPFVVTNALPLPQLKKDHIFLAALVPIKVSQVTKQGGGKFSGNGIATLPFFNAGLAVTFDDIQINELMQLTSGEVNVVRNAFNPTFFGDELPPTDGTGGGSNPDSTGNGTWPPFTDTITINVPFDSIVVVNDSTIWVIPSGGGEAIVVDLGGSTCTLILPPDGNLDNAKVVYNGAARPYNSSNSNDGSLELFTGFLAKFEPSPTQAYGFDSLKYSGFADYYNEMDVNGKVFKMPWKALAPNSYEPVNLKIRRSSDSFPYSDLKVGIWGGDDLVPVAGSSTALQTYNLKGTNEGDEFAVVAKFNSDDKEVHAGGIWAVTYQPKSFNLYIVALEGSNIDEECARMQNEITTIYKQALVNWSVKPLYGFKGIALGDNGLDWTDSEFLSAYNTEMNSVISAFKDWHPNSDPDAYFMIVVPKFSDNTVEGFMPRNRRFGFISAEQLYSRNVAHELGHGAFNLRHTFPEVQQYSTDNLMDYSQDKFALLKAQWDLIHNPESTTGLFDEMEDGAMIDSYMSKESIKEVINFIRESNIANKKTADLSIFSLSRGIANNLMLTDNLILEYVEVNIGSGKMLGDQNSPFLRDPLIIKPIEIMSVNTTTPLGQNGKFVRIYYNRFDQTGSPNIGLVESDNIGISFIIKESQKDEFEDYLHIELMVNATWVSQFNNNIFGNCECFIDASCCFFSTQYIVKNSTGLYSPNGDQIATMSFPRNNAPLIDMLTPVSIPSGFSQGVAYLDAKLAEGKPVVVGVYYRGRQEKQQENAAKAQESLNVAIAKLDELNAEIENTGETEALLKQKEALEKDVINLQKNYERVSQKGPFNTVEPTFHYVVAVGKGFDKLQQCYYYRFYEVGVSDESYGTHKMNRLYVKEGKIIGKQGFNIREYIVTEIRKHNQSGKECTE